jgi:hypothetical protein
VKSLAFALLALLGQAPQQPAQAPPAPPPPRAAAPIDLTGNWVAIVNEDWRWRMLTPPKGDYTSVPLNPAGRAEADKWTEAQDGSCQAYGAGGLMRMPTRVRISWQDDNTLKVETDAGTQTRLLHFTPTGQGSAPAGTARSLQGYTVAAWEYAGRGGALGLLPAGGRGGGAPGRGRGPAPLPRFGTLHAVTTNLSGGWLRMNGVPYSQDAVVTENWDRFKSPNGDEWFVVTTVVSDPKYLQQDFVTSSHFKKEADGSKWSPSSCK